MPLHAPCKDCAEVFPTDALDEDGICPHCNCVRPPAVEAFTVEEIAAWMEVTSFPRTDIHDEATGLAAWRKGKQ